MSEPTAHPVNFAQAGLAFTPEQRNEFEGWLRQPVSPEVLEADKIFKEQLPELLHTHLHQWVAYSGSRRLGFHTSQQSLYQECLAQGFVPGQFVIHYIDACLLHSDWLVV